MTYDPAFAQQARHLCHLGATDPEVAEHFGVSPGTLNRWRITHREFADALVVGGEFADTRVAYSLAMMILRNAAGADRIPEKP